MISYEEYQGYERSGFDEGLRREYRWTNTNRIVHISKYNETSLDEILKGVELINIFFNEPEEDENVDEDGNEILCFEDSKYVSFKLRTDIKSICENIIQSCENLKYLSIGPAIEIPDNISSLVNLRYLEVCTSGVQNIMCQIYKLVSLEVLILDATDIQYLSDEISKMVNLKLLSVMHTELLDLPSKLEELKNLKGLYLNGTKFNSFPESILKLKGLKRLYLGQTPIDVLPGELQNLTELEYLAIWETGISELPVWIGNLIKLKGLYLGRARDLRCLPEEIGLLINLEELFLDGTALIELPETFANLESLKHLSLGNTAIHKFPKLKQFPNLEYCDLSGMVIERVPREFINDKMKIFVTGDENARLHYPSERKGLLLYDTKLLCQPISLFTHEKEFIYAYYEEEKVHLNETKIVFLGDGEAGKSHIIKRIMENGDLLKEFKEESTPGIAISPKDCFIDNEIVKLQIWDFGGQEIMHSMHRFFLTERTLYVIVVNARDNTQDERAQYWLNNIKSFANGCPVIIVLNKMDQNPSATLNERLLKNDYPQIADIIKFSALNDNKELFSDLVNRILKLVRTFDSYAMDFPISWNQVKTTLTEMEENYIIDPQYRKVCLDNDVDDEQIQNWLLDWFHDLGISFNYHRKDQLLAGYMVLKPEWITNAIYIILFNGKSKAQNGIMQISDIVELLKHPPKSVKSISYNITEMPYILGVMRRFEISYSIDENKEFIPMMCDRNQHEDAEQFLNGDCLEYFMEYEYLPNNVLHKLMIKMRTDLDDQKIWLTGMLLKSRDENVSALVRMHGKRIEIFIKSKNSSVYQPKEYLGEIREFLMAINNELNLSAEDTIIYKENDLREEIKYKILLIYLSSGQKEYFSPVFCKLIPVKKILGVVEDEFDVELILSYCKENKQVSYPMIHNMLLEMQELTYPEFESHLLDCCIKLQGNSLQIIQGDENDRNTYLRDMLSMDKKYLVFDQTLNGKSVGGKSAGELDLLIKNCKNLPFTVLEALNLDYVDKKYIATHINKLFSYDTWGAANNYIVIYAENKNYAEFCNRYKTFLSECEYEFPVVSVDERELFTDIRIYDTVLLRNERETQITHIVVKVQK